MPTAAPTEPRPTSDVGAGSGAGPAPEPAPKRRPGRPRDAGADEAILTAVIDLLVEVGFGGLTVDAVAQRAGVGKATIYRRWQGKEQLVLEALAQQRHTIPVPDTGSLRGDLVVLYTAMGDPAAQEATVRLMPALAVEAAANPDLADRLRAFVSDRRAPARTVLARGRERGEVDPTVDVEQCIDLLTGPILYRLLFTGAEVTPAVIARSIDLVLRAIAPPTPS